MAKIAEMKTEPRKEEIRPKAEIPPESPLGTLLKLITDIGSDLLKTPISDAHVSEFATETEVTKPIMKEISFVK